MSNKNIEKADKFFEKAEKAYQKNDYKKAKEYYEITIKLNPNYTKAYYNLALLLSNDYFKDYEKAKEYYEIAIKLNPKLAETYYNLANLLSNDYFKDYEKAKEYLEKAIRINPNYAAPCYNLANLLITDYFKEYEKAKEYYEKAIELNSNYAEVHHNLAVLLFEYLKDTEKSQFHFLEAIDLFKKQENNNIEISRSGLKEASKSLAKNIFISEFQINKVRHLENINIPINKEKLKHLIFTGDNGSGKTSVLEECKNYLQKLLELPKKILFSEEGKKIFLKQKDSPLHFTLNENLLTFRLNYEIGNFVLKYFPTHKEKFSLKSVKKIQKKEFNLTGSLDDKNRLNKDFMVYVTYLGKKAKITEDKKEKQFIKTWFEDIKNIFKKIDNRIENMEFKQNENGYFLQFFPKTPFNPFTFEHLSGGYAAVFDIVTELILECVAKSLAFEDLQGIVLIDEPEVHLHIKMQKRLMPLLTDIFPKIQFIIASHSAFILNSSKNSVIYDLQTNMKTKKLSQISANEINENYLTLNKKKAIEIEKEINEFCLLVELIEKDNMTDKQGNRLIKLDLKLNKIAPYISDNLFEKFKDTQKKLY